VEDVFFVVLELSVAAEGLVAGAVVPMKSSSVVSGFAG